MSHRLKLTVFVLAFNVIGFAQGYLLQGMGLQGLLPILIVTAKMGWMTINLTDNDRVKGFKIGGSSCFQVAFVSRWYTVLTITYSRGAIKSLCVRSEDRFFVTVSEIFTAQYLLDFNSTGRRVEALVGKIRCKDK